MNTRVHLKSPSKKSTAENLFDRADKSWNDRGLKSALRLFRAAAKCGHRYAPLTVGYFYDVGIGVQRNERNAVKWYKRAYRLKDGMAAHNIGIILRDRDKRKQALTWFERAVKLGEEDSRLEIAKIYLHQGNIRKGIEALRRVLKSRQIVTSDRKQARHLLRRVHEYKDIHRAEAVLKSIRKGQERTVALEDALKRMQPSARFVR